MSVDRQTAYLRDMLDSAQLIRSYLNAVSRETFMNDIEKQDAVLRRFEIIGEAASRISPETQVMFPDLPFRSMKGMRNIIAHEYGDVDIEQVWITATTDLQGMLATLELHFLEESP